METANWHYLNSSNIERVAYDSLRQHLYVEFIGSGLYRYYNVPQSVFSRLLAANSHGGFLSAFIKDVYTYIKIN